MCVWGGGGLTSEKNMFATCVYSGELKAKSTLNVSQQLSGVGPGFMVQELSRW